MTRSMLIDATQPEETRVAVLEDGILEEYDVENQSKPSLKGNIYVAKIMRIEPSLQAAFVDFGGNRHGFLPLSEVHPDYFQIPEEDQEKLRQLQEEERLEAEKRENDKEETEETLDTDDIEEKPLAVSDENEILSSEDTSSTEEKVSPKAEEPEIEVEFYIEEETSFESLETSDSEEIDEPDTQALLSEVEEAISEEISETEDTSEKEEVEEDDEKSQPKKHSGRNQYGRVSKLTQFLRQYRIQDVLRKNQVILIQVVKEERGTKGAALTTYMSLPGRYCVLMPNTLKSGGVSRRISSDEDRGRLRQLVESLKLPSSMAMIVRTAGGGRPDQEILKDCEYLLNLWNTVRERALEAVPPTLVHEEASLLKRAVRDLVTPDTDQIIIESSTQDRHALKEYAQQLMNEPPFEIKPWRNHGKSLFAHYGIEEHLEQIVSPIAQLPSGGYLVINQTEALVAIDVNSGKSTNQRDVEATAYRTNLEAAVEVARQLRLRDLAGLIVIDFIDMSRPRHNHQVERALRDALRSDRARIQTGHISSFGLMEMSRQRLRPSLSEAVSMLCVHCAGTGITRSIDNMSVSVLRKIESTASANRGKHLSIALPSEMSFSLLNHKRHAIELLEKRTGCRIEFTLLPAHETFTTTDLKIEIDKDKVKERSNDNSDNDGSSEKHTHRNKTNRRNSDKNKERKNSPVQVSEEEVEEEAVVEENLVPGKKRTRMSRRKHTDKVEVPKVATTTTEQEAPSSANDSSEEKPVEEKPKRRSRKRVSKKTVEAEATPVDAATEVSEEISEEKPKRRKRSAKEDEAKTEKKTTKARSSTKRKTTKSAEGKEDKKSTVPTPVNVDDIKPSDEKKGWWDR